MNRYRTSRRSHGSPATPIIAFLIVVSFGILFAGCSSETPIVRGPEAADGMLEDVTFTEEDIARVQDVTETQRESTLSTSGSAIPVVSLARASASSTPAIVPAANIDLSAVKQYMALRAMSTSEGNIYRVVNSILNIRENPTTGSRLLATLREGDTVTVEEFVNGSWARVTFGDGLPGFASIRYLAKMTTDNKLADEKRAFQNWYFVNFRFVNMRKAADPQSEKIGEIPGDAFVKPMAIANDWAKVSWGGKEGYVSMQYLKPFEPQFIVRQESYTLPILQYNLSQPGVIDVLVQHVGRLKESGVNFMTMRSLYDLVLAQETRDAAVQPRSVILAVTNVSPDALRTLSNALYAQNVPATVFVQTSQLGLSGITEKSILTLMANGMDLQSGGHTGDDLRALTNAQAKLEFEQSRALLEELTKKPVFAFHYPQGGVNDRVMTMAAEAGYLFGVGNTPDSLFSRDQFLRLPSFNIISTMTAEDILKIIK